MFHARAACTDMNIYIYIYIYFMCFVSCLCMEVKKGGDIRFDRWMSGTITELVRHVALKHVCDIIV